MEADEEAVHVNPNEQPTCQARAHLACQSGASSGPIPKTLIGGDATSGQSTNLLFVLGARMLLFDSIHEADGENKLNPIEIHGRQFAQSNCTLLFCLSKLLKCQLKIKMMAGRQAIHSARVALSL